MDGLHMRNGCWRVGLARLGFGDQQLAARLGKAASAWQLAEGPRRLIV